MYIHEHTQILTKERFNGNRKQERSKGCAFVRFKTIELAKQALNCSGKPMPGVNGDGQEGVRLIRVWMCVCVYVHACMYVCEWGWAGGCQAH